MTTPTDDDDIDMELKVAGERFTSAISRVLAATQGLTDEQKTAALQHCLSAGCWDLAVDMIDFTGWAGVPMTENMLLALAGQFDAFINPGAPPLPQPARRPFRPRVVKPKA